MADVTLMVLLLVMLPCLRTTTGHEHSYYTAAVMEYSAIGDRTIHTPKQILMMNANNYTSYIEEAANKNADIIVFPECGLSTIYLPQIRNEIQHFLTPIPNPRENNNPCTDTAKDVPEVLKVLSCAARNSNIYVVVNLPEIASCKGAECPSDGSFFYNTDIVFDRIGTLIARYRKYNLFGEPGFDVTSTAELSTFHTDFGVHFGMATCFDIYFHDPIMNLVKKLDITDIVFPVAWFSELPFLTAIQIQEGWSHTLDVNLLASGYDDPANHNGGSGIYAGRHGRLRAIMPFNKTNKLLISRVAKRTYDGNVTNLSPQRTLPPQLNRVLNSTSERIFFMDYLAPYTTQLLETNNILTTLCDRDLCCEFDVRTQTVSTGPQSIRHRLAVFNGIRPFFGGRTGGIQVCSIIACNNSSLSSCGLPISTDKLSTTFKSISIQGNFNRTNSIHMPSTLLNTILPLHIDSYEFSSVNVTDKLTHIHFLTTKDINNLWTFGIYTREYGLDGLPFTVSPTVK